MTIPSEESRDFQFIQWSVISASHCIAAISFCYRFSNSVLISVLAAVVVAAVTCIFFLNFGKTTISECLRLDALRQGRSDEELCQEVEEELIRRNLFVARIVGKTLFLAIFMWVIIPDNLLGMNLFGGFIGLVVAYGTFLKLKSEETRLQGYAASNQDKILACANRPDRWLSLIHI